jgi:hypothetical protein
MKFRLNLLKNHQKTKIIMKRLINSSLALVVLFQLNANAQTKNENQIKISAQNLTTSCTSFEYDIVAENMGSSALALGTLQFSFIYPANTIPQGAIVSVTKQPKDLEFSTLANINAVHSFKTQQIRSMGTTNGLANVSNWVNMPAGVPMKYARIRVTFPEGSVKASSLTLVDVPTNPSFTSTGALVKVNGATKSTYLGNSTKRGTLVAGNTVNINSTCNTTSHEITNPLVGVSTKNISGLNIYPNPATDFTSLEFASTSAGLTFVKMYDLNGRLQKEIQMNTTVGMNKVDISLSELAVGIYTVNVIENNVTTHTQKIEKK